MISWYFKEKPAENYLLVPGEHAATRLGTPYAHLNYFLIFGFLYLNFLYLTIQKQSLKGALEISRKESIIKLRFKFLTCNFTKKANSFRWIFKRLCINFKNTFSRLIKNLVNKCRFDGLGLLVIEVFSINKNSYWTDKKLFWNVLPSVLNTSCWSTIFFVCVFLFLFNLRSTSLSLNVQENR